MNEVDAGLHKECNRCQATKPLSSFSPQERGKFGVRATCKSCISESSMRWRDKNQDKARDAHLRRQYGITLGQYNDLLVAQGGVCAICGRPPEIELGLVSRRQGRLRSPILVVDHDHETGRVRGLLCVPCNRGIGFLRDDPVVLRSALEYLEGQP